MTYITPPTVRPATFSSRIVTMILAGCALLVLQSSAVHAQWINNGNNINNTNSGNVGVGTTTPGTPLEVYSNQNAVVKSIGVNNASSGASAQSGITFFEGATEKAKFGVNSSGATGYVGGAHAFQVWQFQNAPIVFGTNSTERMRISGGGNIGIGTTTPASRLDVGAGAVRGSYSDLVVGAGGNNAQIELYGSTKSMAIANDESLNGMVLYTNGPSFTTALFLGNTGNAGIGTTTPNKSSVSRALTINGSTDAIYELAVGDVRKGTMFHDGSELSLNNNANGPLVLRTNNSERLRIDSSGNVGIGTAPTAKRLEVSGDLNASGTITGGTIQAKYQDVAEWVETSQALPAGTVVVLDHTRSNQVVASSKSYDTRVAGVISAQPGITLGEKSDSKVLVATTGRVRIKVAATAGPIQAGDLLVTSDVAGVAMKSQPIDIGGVQIHRPGTLVGKALEPLEKGTGEILVLLSLQ